MTKVKMIATDVFHATSVQSVPLQADDKFEVSEAEARELEDRGLAKRVPTAVTKAKSKKH